MIERREIIRAARELVGTRWVHQGRSRDGVDCAGLVVLAARSAGCEIVDAQGYGQDFSAGWLKVLLAETLESVEISQPGDIVSMWIRRPGAPKHLGILGETSLIHVHRGVGKVVEHDLDSFWSRRISGRYRLKEAAPWQP